MARKYARWETESEEHFRQRTGHASLCNCVRSVGRGAPKVTRRSCSCGGYGMTFQKATEQAISEIGEITEETRDAVVKRRDELLRT